MILFSSNPFHSEFYIFLIFLFGMDFSMLGMDKVRVLCRILVFHYKMLPLN